MITQDLKTDEAQIRDIVNNVVHGLRTKDAGSVVSHYTGSVMFALAPPLQHEGAPTSKNLETWFNSFQGPIGYEAHNLIVTTDDSVAFCHSLNRISGTKTDGEHTDMWVRATLGFRKLDGEWKIAHEHLSVPFYMDGSYKAAIDLKP